MLNTQKTGNNDIGISNQQDLIKKLCQKYTLKIDFKRMKSRMGDLFVYRNNTTPLQLGIYQ